MCQLGHTGYQFPCNCCFYLGKIRKVWGHAKPILPENSDSLNGFPSLSVVFRSTQVEKNLIVEKNLNLTSLHHSFRVSSKLLFLEEECNMQKCFPRLQPSHSSHTVKESWYHISPTYCAHFPHIYGLCLCQRERETKTILT